MTTSEQAALLAKHRAIEDDGTPGAALYLGYCYTCERPFPCDVHKMAELKDAEIAELRDSHRATKGLAATFQQQRDDLQAEIDRLKGIVRDYCEPKEGWRHAIATLRDERDRAVRSLGVFLNGAEINEWWLHIYHSADAMSFKADSFAPGDFDYLRQLIESEEG